MKSDTLTTFYENAKAISCIRDMEHLLSYLVKAQAETGTADVAAVLLAEEERSLLRAVAGQNLDADALACLTGPFNREHFLGSVALSGQEAVLTDHSQFPSQIKTLAEMHGIRTMLALPMISDVQVLGVVFLGTRKRTFGREQMTLLRALADLAAVSIERNALLSSLESEVRDLKWVATITDKIHLGQRLDEVTGAILEAGAEVLGADALALYLPDDDLSRITCVDARDVPIAAVEGEKPEQQAALLGMLRPRDPVIIPDLRALPSSDPHRGMILDLSVQSLLGLQLRHNGRSMGLLVAFYKRPEVGEGLQTPSQQYRVPPQRTERQMELCRMLALEAAVALNYSRLLQQSNSLVKDLEEANARLSQQATHDGLTGLSNHRAFHQRLSEQVHRVGRYGEMFSLAMIDVDHFKAYNDAYGHQEGDLALQSIAQIISREIRESDFCARYGGEEFAVVLPHTPKVHARAALERIRKAVDTYPFPNGKLTISIGVAECPVDGVVASDVVEKADRSLYHAKLTGRNRVCLWAAPTEQPVRTTESTEVPSVSVLVVESDMDARRAVEESLAMAGYDLHRANSTQEAMELLRSRKFDIMLSDAIVLDTDGLQVLGLASSIHPTMPIVLTTLPSMAGAAREAMRHGVTDLLLKPYNQHELPVVIERNIERKRLERQMLLQKSTGILLQAIDALVAAIDAKDRLTAGHTTRVTHLCLAIADALGLASEDRYTLELAARLHDIGKLSLPDSALNKNGRLTDDEWAAMRRHPAVGSQIVGAIEELTYVATIVRHHHERLDGKGYPDGLQGEAIPLLARIIAVADAFEAMTSDRAFRARMTSEEAVEELRRCVGTHYSAAVVEALVRSIEAGAVGEALDDAA